MKINFHYLSSRFVLAALTLSLLCVSGCQTRPDRLKHIWLEIKGESVPYKNIGKGRGLLLEPLSTNGKVWMKTGTTFYYSKPWHFSPHSPVYQYKNPGETTKWPCTAVAEANGRIYFSFAVVKNGFKGYVQDTKSPDGKAVLKPKGK